MIAVLSIPAGHSPTRVEYALLDLRFAVNRTFGNDKAYASNAAVLLVTRDSERRLGEIYSAQWRSWYPQLVRSLAGAGAKGIVWDATFLASVPEHDATLAESFELLPVVAAENHGERNNDAVRPALAGTGWKQLVTVGNLPRRTLADTPLPPLGAIAREILSGARPDDTGPTESVWLDFSYDPRSVPALDIADVILGSGERLADSNRTPLSVFTDRIVFVGTDLPGADRHPIPGTRGDAVAGVFAQIASMWSHLSPRRIARVEGLAARGIVFLPAAAIVLIGSSRRRFIRRAGIVVTAVLVLAVPPLAFTAHRIWIPYAGAVALSVMAIVLVAGAHRLQLARNYRTSLGFDPHLLEQFTADTHSEARGVERRATVLCSDVRNYTQLVTDGVPDNVHHVMTTYMSVMEEIVHAHGGYINKFVGDEIVAVFGFPLADSDSEQRAIRAAREMLARIATLNAEWSSAGLPVLDGIGIGIDSGPLRFTNIGGARRVQFDVIGSAINGASRLQGLTKQMARPLIVSQEIAARQSTFPVVDGDQPVPPGVDAFEFIGEAMIRGQGRRRLYGAALCITHSENAPVASGG